jgi:isopentenyldiphosphate isomerase
MSSSHSGQSNYFRSTKERPFHLSVGAVVFNDKGELLCRHFTNYRGRNVDIYLFPTETPELGETFEQTLHRGLSEEVGVTAESPGFIGTLVGFAISGDKVFEKTVIYFMAHHKETIAPLYPNEDGISTVEWHKPEFLLEQTKHLPYDMLHSVLNESTIIKSAQKVLRSQPIKI